MGRRKGLDAYNIPLICYFLAFFSPFLLSLNSYHLLTFYSLLFSLLMLPSLSLLLGSFTLFSTLFPSYFIQLVKIRSLSHLLSLYLYNALQIQPQKLVPIRIKSFVQNIVSQETNIYHNFYLPFIE